LTPSPILKVLSTIPQNGVRSLLMGDQACILYGGAEFSRDTNILVVADAANLARLQTARPLLEYAAAGSEPRLVAALRAEEEVERDADRRYWAPLKRELEQLRRDR
jgi:hypothetical protein